MNWLQAQMVLLDAATELVQFATNWFLQSTLLIAVGLAMGRLLAARGSAVQSAVYRTTLAAVLICPTASALLSLAGVSGWSLAVPRTWTYQQVETIAVDAAPPAPESTPLSQPAVARATLPAELSAAIDAGEQGTAGVDSAVSPGPVSLGIAPVGSNTEIPPLLASEQPIAQQAAAPVATASLSVRAFGWVAMGVSAIWMLISAVLLVRLCVAWWRMSRLRRGAEAADATTSQICHELATKLAVAPPEVLRSPYLPSPCLAGLRKPVVLLPEMDLGLSVRDVLVHELAHLVRSDCHWNLLRLAALSAFFFQPLLWKLSRRLEMTAEEVCDDYVVQYGGDRLEYAYRLVNIAELALAPMAAAGVGIVSLRSMLAKRVHRIMDTSRSLSTRVGNLLMALVLVGGLVGTLIVSLVGISPKRSLADVASATAKEASGDAPAEPAATPADPKASGAGDASPAAAAIAAVTTVAEPPAAELAAAEKPAAAPRVEAAPTLSFSRDPVQLGAGPFDVLSLSFSGNDRFLAASGGEGSGSQDAGQARIWDVAKAIEVASFPTLRRAQSVALSPDGRRVALCSWSGDIWLREVGGEELLHEKFESLTRAAFSPDGKLLVVATQRGQLRTWDALTGKPAKNFHGDTFPFFCVRFSPDGKYLVACGGKGNEVSGVKFAVWNVASREQLYTKKVDLVQVDAPIARLAIFSASISPDSQTLATNGENSVALWDLATGARRSQTVETGGFVYCVEFSPDGKLLASVNLARRQANETGGTVTLWDPSTGNAVGTLLGHESQVRALAFTSDGKTLASGGKDRSIRLWDVATRRQTSALQGAKPLPDADGASSAIMAVAWSPDGASVATANEDGQVSIYGLPSRGLLRSWAAHADAAAALAWSPDGKTLVSGGYDKSIKFWNPATGELVRSLDGHTGWILSLAFSPDGQTLASGSYDRSIRLWNVADGQQRRALTGHTATVRSLAFSHAGKLLASGSADQTVRLWNAADGQEQATLAGHQAAVRSVAFSADDRLLASGGEDQTVKVWNVDSHDLRGTLTGHTDMVSAVAFARGALVSTSWDRTLRVWDVDALVSRHRLSAGASAVVALAVAADGRRLLTAGADQSLTLWKSIVIEDQPAQPQYDALPLLRDDFSNKYSLNWTTIREDKSHLSLLTNPGRLTITTQPGSIRGESDNADGTAAKNIFLIGNPLAETSDFSITLAVSKFDPTTFYQQVGLICYDDDDNYLRWSFEYNTDNATSLAVVRETDAVFKHERLMELPAPERFWMRVTKRGGAYECAYSTDGKDFKLAGSRPWGKHPPKYLGFLAGNGANYAAEEIAVCIDSFELSSLPNDNDQKP